jgi:hypothetical protein
VGRATGRIRRRWSRLSATERAGFGGAIIVGGTAILVALIQALPGMFYQSSDSNSGAVSSPMPTQAAPGRPGGPNSGYTLSVNTNSSTVLIGGPNFHPYIFPQGTAKTLPPPPEGACSLRHEWAHTNGGQDLETTVAEFTIASQTATVVAESAELNVVDASPAEAGDVVGCHEGDIIEGRLLTIDLRRRSMAFEYWQLDGGHVKNAPFGLLIKPREAEKVRVWAKCGGSNEACHQTYRWRLKLNLLVDGERVEMVVDNEGEPFVTAGVSTTGRDVHYEWNEVSRAWSLDPAFR